MIVITRLVMTMKMTLTMMMPMLYRIEWQMHGSILVLLMFPRLYTGHKFDVGYNLLFTMVSSFGASHVSFNTLHGMVIHDNHRDAYPEITQPKIYISNNRFTNTPSAVW